MRKGRRIMQRLLTTLLCLALCTADIIPTGMTVLAQEQEAQPDYEAADAAGKKDQVREEEMEAEEPTEDEPPVIEGDEETVLPSEEEQESVSENTLEEEPNAVPENVTEEESNALSENVAEEEAAANSVMAASEEESRDIASGTSNNISWVINTDGKLTVTGSGGWNRSTDIFAPWYDYRESIKIAEIDVAGIPDASYMFYDCGNLTSINLKNLDTSKVVNMSGMFLGCSNLTTLDVSNFDTSSVTSMGNMFKNCTSLSTLDVSNFDTSSVAYMDSMFSDCSNLTTLDVSNFNTDNVTDMGSMFKNCTSLSTLDVSNFNTSSVTSMGSMFKNCTSLSTLDVSNFNTSSVAYMDSMFSDCSNLTELNLSNFDTSNVTYMKQMFEDCNNLTTLDLSNFDTSNVTNMRFMFDDCNNLTALDVSNFNTDNVTDMENMFSGCSNLTTLDVSNFDTNNVISMRFMFECCINLTTLDVSNFNTDNVTDMENMFEDCNNLTTLDVSNFNTDNVTDMSGMFFGCNSLTTLDLSSFNTCNVTDMYAMFYGCNNLTTIYTPCNVTQSVELPANSGDIWYRSDDGTVVTELPKNLSYSVTLKMIVSMGTSNDISWVIDADGKLTVTGTGDYRREGMYAPWYAYNESIKSAEVAVSGMTDASHMFYGCNNLTSLDLSNFNTSSVTNMSNMFYGCSSLTSLDLSGFDVSQVTTMSYMFLGCGSLISLDLGGFISSNIANINGMFSGCSSLTSLDLSGLNGYKLSQANNMLYGTFYNCNSLMKINAPYNLRYTIPLPIEDGEIWTQPDGTEILDLPIKTSESIEILRSKKNIVAGENIASGTYEGITWTLNDAGKLTVEGTGDFSDDSSNYNRAPWSNYRTFIKSAKIDVTGMTNAAYMFYGCVNLANMDLSEFDTSQVDSMSCMFYDCSSLTSLDLSKFRTGKVTSMYYMFYNCSNLTSLDLRSFDTRQVDSMYSMFYGCSSLTAIDLSSFNTAKVMSMRWMFLACKSLESLDLSNFDTRKVWSMGSMFSGCSSLTSLNVSSFDTSSVTDMYNMFGLCNSLTSLDLSSFDVSNVTNMFDLSSCKNLTDIYTPRNVKQSVALPTGSGDEWYRPDGTEVTELPRDLSYSIVLGKNYTPIENDVLPEDIPEDGVIPEGLWIARIADHTYTGAAIKPEVRVYESRTRLKQGTDYTLSYQNNTKAAQSGDIKPPTVVVKSKGNYSGTETKTFTITKRDISDTHVTKIFTDAYTPLENDKNPNLVFSAKCNNKALKKNTDYALTVKDSNGNEVTSYAAAGAYTAVVKGIGTNFTGEYSFPFEVLNKIPVSKLKISKISAVNYDGMSKTPEPVIKYGKVTLTKDTDYSLNYQNNTAIGTATIEITGMGDYFGTRNVTFLITGLQIKKAKFTGFVKSFPYTGVEVRQTAAVLKYGDDELKEGSDYTVSYSNHLNKGKAAVTYTGIGKYTGTLKKTYNITAYNIKTDAQERIKLSTDTISAAYAKGGARPSLKVYDGTRLLTEGKDYTLSYQNNTAVTTPATKKQPTITVKGKGNYTGTFSEKKTFTITAKNITEATVTAPDVAVSTKTGKYKSTPVLTDSNGKKLKAGTDYDRAYTYTYNTTTEKVLNNGTEVTRNAGDPVDAKDIVPANTVLCVRIKAKEGSNYTGETTTEYRIVTSLINKAKITVKNPSQDNKNLFPYTGQAIRLDKSNLTVKVGKDVLSDDQYEIIEATYKNNVGKGTASVQIKGVGNYGGIATVKFKIGTKSFQWIKRLFG